MFRKATGCLPLMTCALVAGLALLGGCGSGNGYSGSPPTRAPADIPMSGTAGIPNGSLQAWASYGDHLVSVTVTADEPAPRPAGETQRGEGYQARFVAMRVNEVMWSRPQAPPPPREYKQLAPGWIWHDNLRARALVPGPRLEVGHSYLMVVARSTVSGWGDIGDPAIFPYDNGIIGRGENTGGTAPGSSAGLAFQGQRGQPLADQLAATAPDPLAVKYAHIEDPIERYMAVSEERYGITIDGHG